MKRKILAKPSNRHAISFAKRHGRIRQIPLSPAGRKQVGSTPRIMGYVGGFRKKGLKGIALARAIAKDTHCFKKVALPTKEAKLQWAKRSADEILASRAVFINKELAMAGCTDRAILITASLRAAGFPVLIGRINCHTMVKFRHRNKWVIANTLGTKGPGAREMAAQDIEQEKEHKAADAFAEGPSLAQIGIESYRDFFRYRPRKNR